MSKKDSKESDKKRDSLIASKPSSVKSKDYNESGIIFERMSSSSGILDDSELAKDMGIFSGFDINKQSHSHKESLSPTGLGGRRQRTNSFDD